ncbi:MAG: hypothetical protein ABS76_14895 [Pelagibacterium sp. SCN 64-44]|nr:MAG: hypothetical protein ABS76_14895 [Pelagibacterium sp. SCN 64-44]
MPRPKPRLAALLLVFLVPLLPAWACEAPADADLSAFDKNRMAGFDLSRDRGLAEAMLADSADDRAVITGLFHGGEAAIEAIPDGSYRCRTIKMGGLLPLVVYGYFDCAISGGGTLIEKRSGSQRFTGALTPVDGALFYAGALHYGDEKPIAYGVDAERDQVGCLYRVAGETERYRLEMPAPLRESTHDVIELVPR